MRRDALKFMAAGFALAALAACSTSTGYGPATSPRGYGYSDQQIEQNRFRITFRGNSLTERETVETSLLYRAAELTLASGGDYFIVVERDTESRSRMQAYGGAYSGFRPRWTYFHPRWGWRSGYDPFWDDPVSYREITQYEASAEISIHSGQKPADNANAFDARDVSRNLAPRMTAPAAPR